MTLMEDVKPVSIEKNEFRYESKLIELFGLPVFRCKVKVNEFSVKCFSKDVQFLPDPSTKDIKLVRTEIHEFEYWAIRY